jgi:hypothetical protein
MNQKNQREYLTLESFEERLNRFNDEQFFRHMYWIIFSRPSFLTKKDGTKNEFGYFVPGIVEGYIVDYFRQKIFDYGEVKPDPQYAQAIFELLLRYQERLNFDNINSLLHDGYKEAFLILAYPNYDSNKNLDESMNEFVSYLNKRMNSFRNKVQKKFNRKYHGQ